MQLSGADYERVERAAQIRRFDLAARPEGNRLVLTTETGDPDHFAACRAHALSLLLLDFHQLLEGLAHRHEPWWLVDLPPAHEVLDGLLLDLYVEQAERVQARVPVRKDLVVEAHGPPALGPERDGDGLAEAVELQAARGDSVHDRGVVDNVHFDTALPRPQPEVRVRRCTECVPDHEEGDVNLLRARQHLLASALHELAIRLDNLGHLVCLRQRLAVHAWKHGGVRLQVHVLAPLHRG
mmetsp:Transcript_48002/g.133934  ORF Transcript_48002/g.133934 Transcript_48002/m.133934 type:complete len:239 (+) Transcript_48002:206-922(+)